jgi:PAS domain S-box-containing protein
MKKKLGHKELEHKVGKAIRRPRSEKELLASGDDWRSLVDNAPNPIFIADRKGIIQYINHTVPGLEVEKVVGKSHYDYAAPKYRGVMKKAIGHVFETGTTTSYEIAGVGPDGRTSWYTTQLGPIKRKKRVVGVTIMPTDITTQKQAEAVLKTKQDALKAKASELSEVNRALRVLMKQRTEDRRELEGKILSNVKELVAPYIDKLKKSGLNTKSMTYVRILESNLNNIVLPFVHRLSSKYSALTPKELQVAQLIRAGRNSSEIAELLNSSKRTIESHRQGIRIKLGMKGTKGNLRSRLSSM